MNEMPIYYTRLSVNVNKVALLRNSRGGNIPDVIKFARHCEYVGAEGITVHPRPDERHIKYSDVYELKPIITTEFNIEGFPDDRWLKMVLEVKPEQATLVPDDPNQLTSDHGWDTIKHRSFLKDVVKELKNAGIRVSIFVDPDPRMVEGSAQCEADRVELYTGPYAHQFETNPREAIKPYIIAAKVAYEVGLDLNAGHDLNLYNLPFLKRSIPWIKEVSIGHALIADALYLGIDETIRRYKQALRLPEYMQHK